MDGPLPPPPGARVGDGAGGGEADGSAGDGRCRSCGGLRAS